MGIPVLIIGRSGSGKSTSLRNFTNNISVINVLGKRLPFKNKLPTVKSDNYNDIMAKLAKSSNTSIVIDDAGYLMTNQFMRGHSTTGAGNAIFSFYNDIADNFWNLIEFVNNKLPENKIVYFMMHEDRNDFGEIKPKSIGKMLEDKVCIEGMFTISLRCKDYKFYTQKTDEDVAKTPIGMFDQEEIPNDLKLVDDTIRDFYDLKNIEIEKEK